MVQQNVQGFDLSKGLYTNKYIYRIIDLGKNHHAGIMIIFFQA